MLDELRLIEATSTIKHCGDYCHLYVNHTTDEAWMVMGDGDGGEPATTIDEIEQLLLQAGAKKVYVEAEEDPPEDEGWKRLAEDQQLGIIQEW